MIVLRSIDDWTLLVTLILLVYAETQGKAQDAFNHLGYVSQIHQGQTKKKKSIGKALIHKLH